MTLIGTLHHDTLTGTPLSDRIFGRSGRDTIHGGDGNDTIIGGMGQDGMWGGSGADVFVFNRVTDSTIAKPDLIFDFRRGVDKIDLTGLDLCRDDVRFYRYVMWINTDDDAAFEMSVFTGLRLTYDDILI